MSSSSYNIRYFKLRNKGGPGAIHRAIWSVSQYPTSNYVWKGGPEVVYGDAHWTDLSLASDLDGTTLEAGTQYIFGASPEGSRPDVGYIGVACIYDPYSNKELVLNYDGTYCRLDTIDTRESGS